MRKLLSFVLALAAAGGSVTVALAATDPRPAASVIEDLSDLSAPQAAPRVAASDIEAEIVRFRAVDQVAERRAQRTDRAERRAAAEKRQAERRAAAERRAERRERREAVERRAERRAAVERRAAAERRAGRRESDTGGGASATLEAIAACESGGNPRAIGGGGAYRGKYQFSRETWAGVGGSGDPARASDAEQDRRAAILYARSGASSWPVCGR
ncbi:MAG: hypothetical protein AVDCRST_MAG45-1639 [uncultured Solirubrobacterales bacterium]|uniref:Resuscitation-promoting factor core lysozyme-like domain-containing protein n=1 Tax=uncultured Solirubrobacterales bacterium TaxID=768556 RepID=A0A6J4SVG7_9ACTN|nr:MAG: hypothetical protein AVDCRST_MAG45-1639 [uncultured Solirubrobacterales bacterium]